MSKATGVTSNSKSSRSLYVSAMSVKNKGGSDGDSSNARMSVRTGRECFKNLTTAEAVTLVSLPLRKRNRKMRAVILARSAADFPAIREEAEQLRRKYNDSLRDSEVMTSTIIIQMANAVPSTETHVMMGFSRK